MRRGTVDKRGPPVRWPEIYCTASSLFKNPVYLTTNSWFPPRASSLAELQNFQNFGEAKKREKGENEGIRNSPKITNKGKEGKKKPKLHPYRPRPMGQSSNKDLIT
jgi:hypothetical protein